MTKTELHASILSQLNDLEHPKHVHLGPPSLMVRNIPRRPPLSSKHCTSACLDDREALGAGRWAAGCLKRDGLEDPLRAPNMSGRGGGRLAGLHRVEAWGTEARRFWQPADRDCGVPYRWAHR